jgi:hypothetical protein
MHSNKCFARLHCMHKSFLSLMFKLQNGIQISFSLNSKIIELSFESNSNSIFKNIPNLSSNLI